MQHISASELHHLIKDGLTSDSIIIDARSAVEHSISHLQGAVNIPLNQLQSQLDMLSSYSTIYVHCNTGVTSAKFCEQARTLGLTQVIDIVGGQQACDAHGLPITKLKSVWPLMRQTLFAAGTIIMIGMLGYWLWSDWFLVIPTIVGVGLMIAGVTGFCGMSKLLEYMPWNRVSETSLCDTSPPSCCMPSQKH